MDEQQKTGGNEGAASAEPHGEREEDVTSRPRPAFIAAEVAAPQARAVSKVAVSTRSTEQAAASSLLPAPAARAGASGVDVRLMKALRDCQRATASHVRFVKVEHGTCRLSTKRDPLAPVLWDTRPPSVLARWREQAQRNHSPSANRLLPVRQTNSITPDRLVSWRQQAMKGGSLTPSEWPGQGSGSRPGSAKVRDGEGEKRRPQTAGPSRNGIRGLAGGVGMAQIAVQEQITTMEPNPASPDGMGQSEGKAISTDMQKKGKMCPSDSSDTLVPQLSTESIAESMDFQGDFLELQRTNSDIGRQSVSQGAEHSSEWGQETLITAHNGASEAETDGPVRGFAVLGHGLSSPTNRSPLASVSASAKSQRMPPPTHNVAPPLLIALFSQEGARKGGSTYYTRRPPGSSITTWASNSRRKEHLRVAVEIKCPPFLPNSSQQLDGAVVSCRGSLQEKPEAKGLSKLPKNPFDSCGRPGQSKHLAKTSEPSPRGIASSLHSPIQGGARLASPPKHTVTKTPAEHTLMLVSSQESPSQTSASAAGNVSVVGLMGWSPRAISPRAFVQ